MVYQMVYEMVYHIIKQHIYTHLSHYKTLYIYTFNHYTTKPRGHFSKGPQITHRGRGKKPRSQRARARSLDGLWVSKDLSTTYPLVN